MKISTQEKQRKAKWVKPVIIDMDDTEEDVEFSFAGTTGDGTFGTTTS